MVELLSLLAIPVILKATHAVQLGSNSSDFWRAFLWCGDDGVDSDAAGTSYLFG